MSNDRTSRRAAALGLTAGLVGGGATGLVIGVPGLSTAASDATPGIVATQTDTQTDTDNGRRNGPDTGAVDRGMEITERVREALQELVDDGTLTAEQADAVAGHLAGGDVPGRRGGRGPRAPGGIFADGGRLGEIAETLGMERQELADELRSGATLADVAEAHGVDPAEIVDVLIADRIARIDDAVAEGELDALEAAERKDEIEERATAHVNGEHPAYGRNGPPARRPGDAPADDFDGLT